MPGTAALSRDHDVALIALDHPPVNALDHETVMALRTALREAIRDASTRAVVIFGRGRAFSGGADLRIVRSARRIEEITDLLLPLCLEIEDSPKPVTMAIHGVALGGGLELAMAGHYRVALADARLGMPEVKLGLMPGGAGTQRLPRLVGSERALAICLSGEPIQAPESVAIGLLDSVVSGELPEAALAFARRTQEQPVWRTRDHPVSAPADPNGFENARRNAEEAPSPEAARAIITAIEAAVQVPFEEGCRKETELFAQRVFSAEAQSRIEQFLTGRQARKG